MADAKMYAWTTILNGGETEMVRDRKIIHSRSVVNPGEAVTQAGLKCSDAEWQALVDGGSVRPYKFPKMPEGYDGSPNDFIMSQLRDDSGEVDQDLVLALAMTVHGETVEGDLEPEATEEAVKSGAKS
jgi:hypothetical protein